MEPKMTAISEGGISEYNIGTGGPLTRPNLWINTVVGTAKNTDYDKKFQSDRTPSPCPDIIIIIYNILVRTAERMGYGQFAGTYSEEYRWNNIGNIGTRN